MVLRNLIDDDDDDDDFRDEYDELDCNDTPINEVLPCHSPMRNVPLSYDRLDILCHSKYDCAPGLMLSDSEESSYASCGTDDFFDFEEISNTLNLIENWQKLNKKVRFSSTRVQEYGITVGDHPICKDGLALSLDWVHGAEKVYDIDDYESHRQSAIRYGGTKRRRRVSRLDYWQRREFLVRVGNFSYSELSRIECKRNREAVSEFLQDLGTDDYGPPLEVEQEEQGIELEPVYSANNDDSSLSLSTPSGFGWQMNVQILEG